MVGSDATLVTGSPGGSRPLRVGDVLAERYELTKQLEQDPLVDGFRATDQETDAPVLVRASAFGLLREKEARSAVERLRPLVMKGNPLLAAIRDVDREAATVFTVESWPAGTSLRAVLAARRGKGPLGARDVLPVIARLAAALASIPEPFHHGDVRAERVWIDRESMVLTGPHIVAALPGNVVAEALADVEPVRRTFAPEVSEGLGGRPSDRWGVAAIVWEALTGRAPAPGPAPASLGALGPVLQRYLDVDPSARPATLEPLVAACAELAQLPVPQVDARRLSVQMQAVGDDEATHAAALLPLSTDPGLGSATMELPLETTSADDTAPHRAIGDDGEESGELDPRLVRAALATSEHELDSEDLLEVNTQRTKQDGKREGGDDLDPRLVRAALGISMDASGELPVQPAPRKKSSAVTQELQASDLEILPEPAKKVAQKVLAEAPAPARRGSSDGIPAPRRASSDATPAPRLGAGLAAPPRASAPKALAPNEAPPGRKRPVRAREPVPVPEDIKPIPRPRVRESGELPRGPVLFDASRSSGPPVQPIQPAPRPAPAPMGPPVQPAPVAAAAPMPAPFTSAPAYSPQEPPTVVQRDRQSRPSGAPAWASWAIVATALVFGALIVAAGFWYRGQLREEQERQQRIEERLRALSAESP